MTVVDEILATEVAKKLKKKSPERGKELLNSMYDMILSNKRVYDTILKNLNLNKEDALYSIFDRDVRRLMRLAETKKKRLLILDKMLEVF